MLALLWTSTQAVAAEGWSVEKVPAPGGMDVYLSGVSCPSRTACIAVGTITHQQIDLNRGFTPPYRALAERWNGATWSIQQLAMPARASNSELWKVSCASTFACFAIGSYLSRSGHQTALVERWNGRRWSNQQIPNAASWIPWGISCDATAACTVVGISQGLRFALPVAESWNGRRWAIQHIDPLSGMTWFQLYAVSCTSRTACTAVGSAINQRGCQLLVVERWNGVRWSFQPSPNANPACDSTFTGLLDVSCSSNQSCFAIGTTGAAVVEVWNGRRWSLQTFPNDVPPSGISCTSSTACIAVGEIPSGLIASRWEGVAQWDGISWTPQPTPAIRRPVAWLMDVSCSSKTTCTAVGFVGLSHPQRPLAERLSAPTCADPDNDSDCDARFPG
jgi:hypothetical protein